MYPYFYERNDRILNDPIVNCTFEKILWMSDSEFEDWVKTMRDAMLDAWDNFGCPPKSGYNEEEIIEAFNELYNYRVEAEFTKKDELTGELCVLNKARKGAAVDQFFPTMMKARINYSEKDNGHSIYDYFADPKRFNTLLNGCKRHFKRDSFYAYSRTMKVKDKTRLFPSITNAYGWVKAFSDSSENKKYGFWINESEQDGEVSSGYKPVEYDSFLSLTPKEITTAVKDGYLDPKKHLTNVDLSNLKDSARYYIRIFPYGLKMFPKAFTAFRIGYIQVAVNFPPLTAKYLYEYFTKHIAMGESITVYDSSSGWGGRILGAMSVDPHTHPLHYVGNDPNTDNFIPSVNKTRYEVLADFFNEKCNRSNFISRMQGVTCNTYEIFQTGSEIIHELPEFQKYEGKFDLVFTSPPYFNRESYSEDDTQSYKKFQNYASWRDGFLRPTLETAYKYLKSDRWILWNIADVLVGKEKGQPKYLPLEQDSIDILKGLGAEYRGKINLCLASMPGQNRIGADGKPTAKNFVSIKEVIKGKHVETYFKSEPILTFYKK